MSAMTEYAKNVFNDKALLRDKLKIFLHTTDTAKIESYAQACENFLQAAASSNLDLAQPGVGLHVSPPDFSFCTEKTICPQ